MTTAVARRSKGRGIELNKYLYLKLMRLRPVQRIIIMYTNRKPTIEFVSFVALGLFRLKHFIEFDKHLVIRK